MTRPKLHERKAETINHSPLKHAFNTHACLFFASVYEQWDGRRAKRFFCSLLYYRIGQYRVIYNRIFRKLISRVRSAA